MGLVNLLVLTWLSVVVRQSVAEDPCFDDPAEYVDGCNGETASEILACDCRNETTCHFKLVIRSNGTGVLPEIITVNGLFQGPTLIVNQDAIVVVDVVNKMPINGTSIHWHGMHQYDVPWMDGVSYITQWPIKPGRKFRYIFRAVPSGTFWYHSHQNNQREKGCFGALIVKETDKNLESSYGDFEDKPDEHTLVFLDFKRKTISDYSSSPNALSARSLFAHNADKQGKQCLPDYSLLANSVVGTYPEIIINSVHLSLMELEGVRMVNNTNVSMDSFYVEAGNTYRFRLIGAMEGTAYRFSIDEHNLTVIATDGYLVKPFVTDYIIIHVGERYDFLLTALSEPEAEITQFPIRTETLAIDCDTGKNLKSSGYAALIYGTKESVPVNITYLISQFNETNPRRCSRGAECKVLNCPFEFYMIGLHLECHHIDELSLLYETDEDDVPDSENINLKRTKFFNFKYDKDNNIATVNGKQFTMPPIALQVSSYKGMKNECNYDTNCSSPDMNACVQIVDIPQDHYKKSIRFVLSSLGDTGSIFTHPIHLHGHSFHVVKIGFPEYHRNGSIKSPTEDLQPDDNCNGPPHWTNETVHEGIRSNRTTIRKDTVVVPAGGYVVIDFIADNPGYWFMHCHIDYHLLRGMAVVIRELKACQNEPPAGLKKNNTDFCWSVKDFKNATSAENVSECSSKERQAHLFEKKNNRFKKLQEMEKKGRILLKDQTVKF